MQVARYWVAFMTGGVSIQLKPKYGSIHAPGVICAMRPNGSLEKLQKQVPFEFFEIDIDQDAVLRERYNDEVPVVFIHGRKAFKYRIEPRKFSRILLQGPEEPWAADAVQPESNPGSLCD